MPARINKEFRLPATPAKVLQMLTDSEFLKAKVLIARSGTSAVSTNSTTSAVSVTRTIDTDLPAIVQKFIGSELTVIENQKWNLAKNAADFTLTIPSAPVDISGEIKLTGDTETSVLITGSVKVNLPIFGAAAEPQVVSAIEVVLSDEEALCRKWILEH